MAEQDRYGGWFGFGRKSAPEPEHLSDKVPSANEVGNKVYDKFKSSSGAEQDRLGSHFEGKAPSAPSANEIGNKLYDKFSSTSGAEQDRYGSHFEGKTPSGPSVNEVGSKIYDKFKSSSGAEQDRYASHFEGKPGGPSANEIGNKIYDKFKNSSGAEQDRYGAHFGGDRLPSADDVSSRFARGSSGAEQDRYGGWFGGKSDALPSARDLKDKIPRGVSGAEQDRYGSHFGGRDTFTGVNATGIGLLQSAVLPSFGFHAGLSLAAYGVSRSLDRADGKDWAWATGMTANAWWSAVGARVLYQGLTVPQAWSTLGYTDKLLLGGVTAWGLRLTSRVVARGFKRGNKDDARYQTAERARDSSGFWNKALISTFLPEAVAQTLISLPFVLPFRARLESITASPDVSGYRDLFYGLAVFLFTSGFALEVVADAQLEEHKKKNPSALNREGVWSIVRHPNYLGDALVHAAFPVLLLGAGLLHPFALIGPVANYVFLRYIGGDKENEASQEERYAKENPTKKHEFDAYKSEKNSFWPSVNEAQNPWVWAVVGAGVAGVVVEQAVRGFLFR